MRQRRRRRGRDGFRSVEEVAATAGLLLPRRNRGRHLQAMAAWRSAVGVGVSRVTRVAHLGPDAVTVEVPDAVWGETLRRLEPEILGRFRDRLGADAPRRIEFRVARGFWRPARPVSPRDTASVEAPTDRAPGRTLTEEPPGDPAVDAVLDDRDVPVVDEHLRERLRHLGDRYLARRRPLR